jgi:hypothetical protein
MMQLSEGLDLMRTRLGRRLVWQMLRQRIFSRRYGIGLMRDLDGPAFTNFRAKVPTTVRLLEPDDDLSLLEDLPELDPRLARYRMDQRWLMAGDLPTPWVAIDPEG